MAPLDFKWNKLLHGFDVYFSFGSAIIFGNAEILDHLKTTVEHTPLETKLMK